MKSALEQGGRCRRGAEHIDDEDRVSKAAGLEGSRFNAYLQGQTSR